MPYSHLPYPSNPSLEALKVIATDRVIWVSTTGNDATGDGSESNPYLTLDKAMTVAREFVITGKAILYIRLKRGEYNIVNNIDLYHPQGSNIIIEGDPAAFQQRVIWQVEGYSWNLEQWAGGGHTATIRVWDGLTTNANGHTLHGFSADQTGMYFAVTNANIASRSGYRSTALSNKGVYTTPALNAGGSHSYMPMFNGDRFFNHGFSYEDAQGIIGIGRIHAATASGQTLAVQFNNLNYDCRCPGWTWGAGSGGLNNTISWAGIPSNYPEPQYSQPNGYYGDPTWTADPSGDSTAYPSNPGVSPNTNDPYVLSLYPVVLRGDYRNSRGTLFLKNGTIRAIRNLMFASDSLPYTSANGYNYSDDVSTLGLGLTLNSTLSLQSTTTVRDGSGGLISGTGLQIEDSTVGIRHLGFHGIARPIIAKNSQIRSFYENTIDPVNNGAGSNSVYIAHASSGATLDNAPILYINQCEVGIMAYNTTLDFVDSSGYGQEYNQNFRMEGIYISTRRNGLRMFNSSLAATSMFVNSISETPVCTLTFVYPLFPGATISDGVSADFNAYTNLSIYPYRYPVMKAFMELPDGQGAREIGYVNSYVTTNSWTGRASDLSGLTAGATRVGNDDPSDYSIAYASMLKLAPFGLSFWNRDDIRNGITAAVGGTFSVRFYKDMALSGVCAEYIIGKNSILISGANGFTRGWSGMGTVNSIGSSAANCLVQLGSYGGHFIESQGTYVASAIFATENSTINILKSLWINNGGHNAVDIRKNSRLNVGDTHSIYPGTHDTSASSILAIPNDGRYINGALLVTGYAQSAVRIAENSSAVIGTLFTKHPMHSDGIGAANNPNDTGAVSSPLQNCIGVYDNSSVKLGAAFCVGHIGGSTIRNGGDGLFTTIRGTKIGNRVSNTEIALRDTFIHVDRGSQFILRSWRVNGYGPGGSFMMDGGTGAALGLEYNTAATNPEVTVFNIGSGSHAVVENVNALSTTAAQTVTGIRFFQDRRSNRDRKILTRDVNSISGNERTVYGSPASSRIWMNETNPVGYGFIQRGINIGTEGSGGSQFSNAAASPNIGCTLHAHVEFARGGSISTR